MSCDEARAAWLEARYAQRELGAELSAHVAACAECRAFAAAQVELDRALAAREPALAGPGFDTRFFARLSEARTSAQRRHRLWLFAPLAAAAALALFLVVHRPAANRIAAAEDLALAQDLELVEALPTLEHLDQAEPEFAEDYETLANVDLDELTRMGSSSP